MDTTTTAPRPRIRPSLASAARELQRIAAMQTAFLTDRELDAMGDRAGWLIGYAVKTRSLTLGDVCTKLSMGQIRSELFDVEVLVDSALADLSSLVHIPDRTRGDPSPGPLFDDALATNGVRASGRKRPIQDRDADGCLSLLSGETACPQPRSDQRLVAAHHRFDQRALAIICRYPMAGGETRHEVAPEVAQTPSGGRCWQRHDSPRGPSRIRTPTIRLRWRRRWNGLTARSPG